MYQLQTYLAGVVITALICSIIPAVIQNSTAKEISKLLCGLAMTITIIAPVRNLDNPLSFRFNEILSDDPVAYASEGEILAKRAMADIIKAETETYILDKAYEMGSEISVEVSLSEDEFPVPESVVITGSLTPNARSSLQELLYSQIGIAKENIKWIG